MKKTPTILSQLKIEPLTLGNWALFENLFGERGACAGCWCMFHRSRSGDFEKNKYDGNKKQLLQLVKKGQPVGLLAIRDAEAIAWLSLAPREQFIRLENSRIHKRIDDEPVWSITCFFIKKEFRNKGVSSVLIQAAKNFGKKNQIKILEAYPVKPYAGKMPDVFAWTGIYSTFEKAGFKVVRQQSKSKPMMRFKTPSAP